MTARSGLFRKLAMIGLSAVALYVAACGGFYWVMRQPPSEFGRIMAKLPMPLMVIFPFRPMWGSARAGQLSVGDTAPDFSLPLGDGSGTVRLSDFRGKKPVVLVFGSYT
jgi:hypothetical protein